MLVTTLPRERKQIVRALSILRVCDGVQLRPAPKGAELVVIAECDAECRPALERRLSEYGAPPNIGWAEFPGDGVTLNSLLARARAASRRPRLVPPR